MSELTGWCCEHCGTAGFHPASLCHGCGAGDGIRPHGLGDEGRLYTFTEVHVGKPGLEVPYTLGYVDLPGGVRILARIDGPADGLAPDQSVRLTASGGPACTFAPVAGVGR